MAFEKMNIKDSTDILLDMFEIGAFLEAWYVVKQILLPVIDDWVVMPDTT